MSTTTDPTELKRRALITLGVPEADLAEILEKGGEAWDVDGLRENFETIGFQAPFVVVIRKADGVKGSLEFTHRPRFYFNFEPA